MALVKRNTAYSLDDIVNTKYGIKLKCTTAGTTDTDPLILNGTSPITDGTVVWEVQEEGGGGGQGLVDYEVNKNYNVGDIVIYNDRIFRCITAHTSTTTFDATKWKEISACANITSTDKVNLSFEQNLNDTGVLGVNWTPADASPIYEAGKSGFGLNAKNHIKSDTPWFNIIPRVDDFTIDFWFELKSGFDSSTANTHVVRNNVLSGVPRDFMIAFGYNMFSIIFNDISGNEVGYRTVSHSSYIGNGFHHAIFTRQGTNAQLKVDGMLIYDIYDFPATMYVTDSSDLLVLGSMESVQNDKLVIDDFRIY